MRLFTILLLISMLLKPSVGVAADTEKEYAKAALNGLKVNQYAKYVSVPFEAYFNLDDGRNRTQSILYLKPVLPFHLTDNYDLIVRTIAPLYERTPTRNFQRILAGKYINGWGDLNPTFFITPAKYNKFIIGLGPTISIPTATNSNYIGSGKWSLGPELALYYLSDNWVIGCLTYNIWSVAGNRHRVAVNTFEFQYVISYVMEKGWYISTNPSITVNWNSPGNQQWIVPFGLGAGRTMKLGEQPINMSIYGYYNAVRPPTMGPNWQLQLEIEWLFQPFSFLR